MGINRSGGGGGGGGAVDIASQGVALSALTVVTTLASNALIPVSTDGGVTISVITKADLQTVLGVQASPATAYTLTGPASGNVSVASTNFTVSANGTLSGNVVITPSDGGNGGTFTPSTITLTSASTSGTFTYVPGSTGTKTISATNNGSLTNPSSVSYTVSNAAATAVTMTGPTSGTVSTASSNFTVGANGAITGTIVVTPSDGGVGGAFTPTTVSISSGTPTGTFTYTPASTGAKTISVTSNGSLTNPANLAYTANAAAGPAYLFTPAAYSFDTSSANISTNGYASAGGTIYLQTASGQTPANVKMGWSKSSTQAPAVYTDTAIGGHPNSFNLVSQIGGWEQGGPANQGFNGLYGDQASLYAWGTAGTYYLWLITDDGFSAPYSQNGTPVGRTFA